MLSLCFTHTQDTQYTRTHAHRTRLPPSAESSIGEFYLTHDGLVMRASPDSISLFTTKSLATIIREYDAVHAESSTLPTCTFSCSQTSPPPPPPPPCLRPKQHRLLAFLLHCGPCPHFLAFLLSLPPGACCGAGRLTARLCGGCACLPLLRRLLCLWCSS